MDILSKNYKDLFISENCWDTILQVENKEFKAHRAILSARSTVFAAMFQHDTSEKQTGIVNIPDCDPDSFKTFLEYVYCGRLENISFDCALPLYAISDKYNVQELKSFCIKYLMHNITTENVCEIVILADAYDEASLFSAVQRYFNENFKKIVTTSDWENLLKKNFRLANKLLIEKSKAE